MTTKLSAYLEQEVLSASPVELVCLLYQAAIVELREARRGLAAGDVPARCAAISKACRIIGELLGSLQASEGQDEIVSNLSRLYTYSMNRLLEANLKKQDAPLAEVLGLLTTLNEGWQGVLTSNRREVTTAAAAVKTHFFAAQASEPAAQSWSF